MLKRGILIVSFFLMVATVSFAAGYFIMDSKTKSLYDGYDKKPVNNTVNAQTGDNNNIDKTNENTKINRIDVYIKGNTFEDNNPGIIPQDLIGKTKEEIEDYFKKDGYSLEKFTSDEVIVKRVITDKDKWPSNCFVILADSKGNIKVYQTNMSGELKLYQDLELNISSQPEDERAQLQKGIICKDEEELSEYEGLE